MLVHAPDDMHFRTLDELFPAGAQVFMLGNPNYGSQGEVSAVPPPPKKKMEVLAFEGNTDLFCSLYLKLILRTRI